MKSCGRVFKTRPAARALQEVVELPEREIDLIQDAMLNLPDEQKRALKPVYEQFGGAYS